MKNPKVFRYWLWLSLAALAGAILLSCGFILWHLMPHQPPGLTLKLSLPKDHFFQGEEIPATLTFSNKSKEPFHLMEATYDRSGRIGDITFYANNNWGQPVVDPLGWYFKRAVLMGGGGSGITNLGEWSATLAANQWLRFDHPGVYTIYVRSNRVEMGTYKDFGNFRPEQVSLVSNRVTITIDPLTVEQEKKTIADARQRLTVPWDASSSPSIMQGVDELRWLQTPSARAELRPLLSNLNPTAQEAAFGILAAPDPGAEAPLLLAAVEQGKPLLNDAIQDTYAALKTYGVPNPGFGGLNQTFPNTPFTQAVADAKKEITEASEKASGGEGPVYVSALWSVFERTPQDPAARAAIVKHQLELSPDQRKELIMRWKMETAVPDNVLPLNLQAEYEANKKRNAVGGLDLLPVLRQAATSSNYDPYALALLSQMSPDDARPLVVEDIKRPQSLYMTKPHVVFGGPLAWECLPDRPIPELTETFREKLKDEGTDFTHLLPVIDRYGTPDLLPDVVRFFRAGGGPGTSVEQNACLRFWIKCDPSGGMVALRQTIQAPSAQHRYGYLLEQIFKNRWNDLAQPFLRETLQDTAPDVVLASIKILYQQGDQDCVESVISALERIHTTTTTPTVPNEMPIFVQKQQQASLARTLLESQRWNYSPEQKERLISIANTAK